MRVTRLSRASRRPLTGSTAADIEVLISCRISFLASDTDALISFLRPVVIASRSLFKAILSILSDRAPMACKTARLSLLEAASGELAEACARGGGEAGALIWSSAWTCWQGAATNVVVGNFDDVLPIFQCL